MSDEPPTEEPAAPVYEWRIVHEAQPNHFTPTGEHFTGTVAEVEAHYAQLQADTGRPHGAEVIRQVS